MYLVGETKANRWASLGLSRASNARLDDSKHAQWLVDFAFKNDVSDVALTYAPPDTGHPSDGSLYSLRITLDGHDVITTAVAVEGSEKVSSPHVASRRYT